MRIAVVRGDFASPWELQNFMPLLVNNEIVLFTGLFPVGGLGPLAKIRVVRLLSPVDLNFGKISRSRMGILNRIFVDAHVLFGLEGKLKGFDVAHCAETYFTYTRQSIIAKEHGIVKAVVSTVWENIPFNNEGINGRKDYKKDAFDKVDRFLAVTRGARDALVAEGCPPEKIDVLMPGVNLNRFRPLNTKRFRAFRKNEKICLLFVGRLELEKGVIELLSVYRDVVRAGFDTELFIAGEGSMEHQAKALARDWGLGNIHFLGNIPYEEMPYLYSYCDVFLHYPVGSKTWKEQYGMVLVEAMACGMPVVGLKSGSVEEIVGSAGMVSEARDFFRTLVRILKERKYRLELSRRSLRMAELNYDAKMYSRKLERIYEEVLRGK